MSRSLHTTRAGKVASAALAMLGASLAGVAAPAAQPAPSPAIQRQIDALLNRRLQPQPLPIDLPNPFRANGGAVRIVPANDTGKESVGPEDVAVASPAPKPAAAATNAEVLALVAARLKVSGVIMIKDQLQAVINGLARKEGDAIAADWNGSLVHARIVRLSAGQIVLRYGDAEVTLKF